MKFPDLPDPAWVGSCLDELEELWHNESMSHPPGSDEPLDGLILTVLSQNTNDRNRDRAFESLKERFNSWDEAAGAEIREIAEAIRPGGLANIKAARIHNILKTVLSEAGSYSLQMLKSRDTGRVRSFLEKIPGIGPKTIACVLLFDLGRPAFPVDTHVARVARRIGWVDQNMPPDNIESVLESVVGEGRFLGAHLNLITHGRYICKARAPRCSECPLAFLCDHNRKTVAE
jgi:endonuclease-3